MIKIIAHYAAIAAVYIWTMAAIFHRHELGFFLLPLCIAAIITMPHPDNWKGSRNA